MTALQMCSFILCFLSLFTPQYLCGNFPVSSPRAHSHVNESCRALGRDDEGKSEKGFTLPPIHAYKKIALDYEENVNKFHASHYLLTIESKDTVTVSVVHLGPLADISAAEKGHFVMLKDSEVFGMLTLNKDQEKRLENLLQILPKWEEADKKSLCMETVDRYVVTYSEKDGAEIKKDYLMCGGNVEWLNDASADDLRALGVNDPPIIDMHNLVVEAYAALAKPNHTMPYSDVPREQTMAYRRRYPNQFTSSKK